MGPPLPYATSGEQVLVASANNPIGRRLAFLNNGRLPWFLWVFVLMDRARLAIVTHGIGTIRQSRGGRPMLEVSK